MIRSQTLLTTSQPINDSISKDAYSFRCCFDHQVDHNDRESGKKTWDEVDK